MHEQKSIDVAQLLLDTSNFRTGSQESQKSARDAIIHEQGRKLQTLALDVVKHGFSPSDLPIVYPLRKNSTQYVMLEGNRRLVVIKLILDPELAKGTVVYKAFQELHKKYGEKFPTEISCVSYSTRAEGLIWVERKHSNALDGAGTEPWNTTAKDRFDAELGKPTPNLDAMDFVRKYGDLTSISAEKIDSAKFPLSTLGRLMGDEDVRKALGLALNDGALRAQYESGWTLQALKVIVEAIASGRFEDDDFNVRKLDSKNDRQSFIGRVVGKLPTPSKAASIWTVSPDAPLSRPAKKADLKSRNTAPTAERKHVIPRGYKLKLPDGKVNDVFDELRTKVDVEKCANAASVLLRVFLVFGIDRYIKVNKMTSKTNANVLQCMRAVVQHMIDNSVMTNKELQGINRELGSKTSLISPETWNMYVHNETFTATPNELKVTWNRLETFVTALWAPVS